MKENKIAIVGLGYVGLPLAIEFSKKNNVIGFDIDKQKIFDLSKQYQTRKLKITSSESDIKDCNIYVVTVPTPVNKDKIPDISFLKTATKTIAKYLEKNDTVIYESTVYPGCTEEVCVPILEKKSGLKFNKDFFVGYSPERINPGDKVHTLTSIKKITSGSTVETAEFIDKLYTSIISAGTYKVSSIKIAEAAKAIENAQRDVNISFINELSLIFDKMNIDTYEVLEAASTKWNFINLKPGLVGGHCIGVDPYYLTYQAKKLGYNPQVISSGRDVNEKMGSFVARKVIDLIKKKKSKNGNKNILILGFTFKENCADIRNTGVINLYNELIKKSYVVDVYDTWANSEHVFKEYNIPLLAELNLKKKYSAVILAVSHAEFESIDFLRFKNNGSIIFDIKGILDKKIIDGRL